MSQLAFETGRPFGVGGCMGKKQKAPRYASTEVTCPECHERFYDGSPFPMPVYRPV